MLTMRFDYVFLSHDVMEGCRKNPHVTCFQVTRKNITLIFSWSSQGIPTNPMDPKLSSWQSQSEFTKFLVSLATCFNKNPNLLWTKAWRLCTIRRGLESYIRAHNAQQYIEQLLRTMSKRPQADVNRSPTITSKGLDKNSRRSNKLLNELK